MTNKDKLEKAIQVLKEEYYQETGCDMSWHSLANHTYAFDSSTLVDYYAKNVREYVLGTLYTYYIIMVDIGSEWVYIKLVGEDNSWSGSQFEDPPFLVEPKQVTHTIFERI